MHERRGFILAIMICFFVVLFGGFFLSCYPDDKSDRDKELYNQVELFSDVLSIIQADYVDETEPKKLIYGALGGMLSSLDDYSQFLDPDNFKEMEIETRGEFGGLGIEIGLKGGVLTVIAPIDGTPAYEAGIKPGDSIVKIDGEITKNITIEEAVKRLRGKPKISVMLTIWRESEGTLMDFTVVRDVIKLKSIKEAKMLDESVGYIKLVEFQKNTPSDLGQSVLKLLQDGGMKALILDVRNNPGGLLDVAYEVSEKFLPKDAVVVSIKGRIPQQNKVFRATGKKNFTDFPMVVLVNEGSASASEILAGAIQDNKRGVIVGVKTFGKGSVQTVIPLRDGSAARLTTAAYYTPADVCIDKKGIMPDVVVPLKKETETREKVKKADIFEKLENKSEEPEKETVYDNQLKEAMDILRGILVYREASIQA